MNKTLRDYQLKAIKAIDDSEEDCVVNMFCGSGKSVVMKTYVNDRLEQFPYSVFVFPRLALITQFQDDYLKNIPNVLSVSSEPGSTTDQEAIKNFIESHEQKIVCVTYQSLHTWKEVSPDPDIMMFDEAHHAVESYVSGIISDIDCKKVFMTATPPDDDELGPIVYEYMHHDGVIEGNLNDFNIMIDFSTENTNESIYDSIIRAVMKTKNSRVLTYHQRVNTDDTSVKNFVNQELLLKSFKKIEKEFPGHGYTSVKFLSIDAGTLPSVRKKNLKLLDGGKEHEIVILSSCKTIGEGVDTKKANMVVFVDAKNALVDIIQNIGRIVRKQPRDSTILIPCWVDKTKYEGAEDKDAVIREDLGKQGNFNGILNVISALRQHDPELYELCLKYPKVFTKEEMKKNFKKQGVKDTGKVFTQKEIDVIEEKMPDVELEIHTHDVENPIEIIHPGAPNKKVLYKDEDGKYHEMKPKNKKKQIVPPRKKLFDIHSSDEIRVDWLITEESLGNAYIDCQVTVEYDAMKRAQEFVQFYKDNNRLPKQHSNNMNEQRLASRLSTWKQALKGKGHANLTEHIKEYLDTEIPGWDSEKNIENFQLEKAEEIVQFYKDNNQLPQCGKGDKYQNYLYAILCKYRRIPEKYLIVKQYLDSEIPDWNVVTSLEEKAMEIAKEIVQFNKDNDRLPGTSKTCQIENKLAIKLQTWKMCIGDDNSVSSKLYPSVKQYLDTEIPNWCNSLEDKAMDIAKEIVQFNKDNGRLPSQSSKKEKKYENTLANKLNNWRTATRGLETNANLPDTVKQYLDTELPGWNDKINLIEKHMEKAVEIVQFYKINNRLPKHNETEKILANILSGLKKIIHIEKYISIKQYIDNEIPRWNDTLEDNAMEIAMEIVKFYKDNNKYPHSRTKLGQKLGDLRKSLKGKGTTKLYPTVKEYLDTELPGWETGKSDSPETEINHHKCPHIWEVVEQDDEYHYKKCKLCDRRSKQSCVAQIAGYTAPNPEKKLEINTWLSQQTFIPGKAIVLDAKDMKTCNLLPFDPSNIIVAEYDTDTFEENSKDPKFGKCLVNGDFLEVLKTIDPSEISLIYADFTGHFDKWIGPLLEYLSSIKLNSGVVLGITWSECGSGCMNKRGEHKKNLGKFLGANKWDDEIENSPRQYGYGHGANMHVDFFRKM